jgi:hypothetical protein
MRRKFPAAAWILIAMVLGILIGYAIFVSFPDKKTAAQIAGYVSIVSDVFLRLIKMLIGPLVFSTLVVGIAHMGDAASVGRVFGKALAWFITASLVSLILGLFMANLLQPGVNLGLPLPDIGASANLATSKFTLKDFVSHLVPKSFAEAMANNEILQIVVFSMFFGVALSALGEKAKTLVAAIDELSHAMLKITGYVMKLAPLAVMAAMAATVAVNGLEILLKFASSWATSTWACSCCGACSSRPASCSSGRACSAAGPDQGGVPAVLRDGQLRGGLPEDPGRAGPLRRASQDLGLRDADGLLVQPRRLDDVLHVRRPVHRAGLRHRAAARHADHHAAHPDADLQGHGRRAARLAGGDRGDAEPVQHPRGRPAAHPRRGHLPRHGPLGDERGRQLDRHRGGRQVGGRADVRGRGRRNLRAIEAEAAARAIRSPREEAAMHALLAALLTAALAIAAAAPGARSCPRRRSS